jgi:hypothetical protein
MVAARSTGDDDLVAHELPARAILVTLREPIDTVGALERNCWMDATRTPLPLGRVRRAPTVFLLALLAALPATSCGGDGAHSADAEPGLGEAAQAVVTVPPAHAWAFDEASGAAALDTGTPGGVNGTLGALATRVTPGRVGAGAVSLPGGAAGSLVSFGAAVGQVHTGDFTATFWINTTHVPNSSFELLGNRSCASSCNFWGLRSTSTNVTFEMYEDTSGTHGAAVTLPASVSDGQWHFIAARRSATQVTLVIDGQSKSLPIAAPANITTTTPLSFGDNPIAGSFGTRYLGLVDEVRLHSRALADYELLPGTVKAPPSDSCHAPGTCDVTTGTCTDPPEPDGTPCDDGDLCTQGDACQAAVCAGTAVTCAAADACHALGTCSPATGACSNPAAPDDTSCDDGDPCTQTDACVGGTCAGGNPKACTAQDGCHDAGVCDPATGQCSKPVKADGASCDDGDACTTSDACQSGACTGTAVVCSAADECHEAGTCDPQGGTCTSALKPDGAPCTGGVCTSGVCSTSGTGGSGGGGGATTGSSGSGGAGGSTGSTPMSSGGGPAGGATGGCGCRAARSERTGPGAVLLAVLLAVSVMRSSRHRR